MSRSDTMLFVYSYSKQNKDPLSENKNGGSNLQSKEKHYRQNNYH